MCGLCGMLGAGAHWSDALPDQATAGHAERRHRLRVANTVLEPFGLRCAAWGARMTLYGPTGKGAVVDGPGNLWPAAEKLLGRPLDPLDPELLARLERR